MFWAMTSIVKVCLRLLYTWTVAAVVSQVMPQAEWYKACKVPLPALQQTSGGPHVPVSSGAGSTTSQTFGAMLNFIIAHSIPCRIPHGASAPHAYRSCACLCLSLQPSAPPCEWHFEGRQNSVCTAAISHPVRPDAQLHMSQLTLVCGKSLCRLALIQLGCCLGRNPCAPDMLAIPNFLTDSDRPFCLSSAALHESSNPVVLCRRDFPQPAFFASRHTSQSPAEANDRLAGLQFRWRRDFLDPAFLFPRMADKMLVGFLIFSLYWHAAKDPRPETVSNIISMLYTSTLLAGFVAVTFLPGIMLERALFLR